MPFVSQITIFPVKSCDGISLPEVEVLPSGALRHDRQFALVDSAGRFINAKNTPLIHQLRLLIDPERREFTVSRRAGGEKIAGRLQHECHLLSDWLSHFFSLNVSIIENEETGFPDDLDAPGPTVISLATMYTVSSWFPTLTADDIRQRFRANIEIDGVDPFWEDRLFSEDRNPRPFRVGPVTFGGTNPCQRCVVPTRDPVTGDVTPHGFAQEFRKRREETLPPWAARNRFDHFYRLSTNTCRLDNHIGSIHVGDRVELPDES